MRKEKWMKWLLPTRRLCQLLIILLFCLLPWLNFNGFYGASGSLFSFDFFGIPFADPASALQTLAGSLSLPIALDWRFLFGSLLALLAAFCFGRVFCGWICPYGFFSEMANNLTGKNGIMRSRGRVFAIKAAILMAALAAAGIFAYPFVSVISMPGELSLFPLEIWLDNGLSAILAAIALPLIALIFEFVSGSRLWCKYCCPQSVMLGAAAWLVPPALPVLRIDWNVKKCTCGKQSPCAKACSMSLNPRHKNGPPRRDCVMCGDCAGVCAKHGHALNFVIKR